MVHKKDSNAPHAESVHPSKVIPQATGRAMGLYLTDTFKPYKDCALRKGKRGSIWAEATNTAALWENNLHY